MKVLVVGSGGREHALCWRLHRDGHEVVCAPGNPGIASVAECASVPVDDLPAMVELARSRSIELAVVGPEAPLVAGLADDLRAAGVFVFGPGKEGAQLEASKDFSKRFFARHGIRSAPFVTVDDQAGARSAITELGGELVVKADGLAAGKGVVVCSSAEQAREAAERMLAGAFGDAGKRVVIERRIRGRELSVMALCDGEHYQLLAQAEDHKAIFDGDEGPNTGGMGTVSPAPWATEELLSRSRREIFDPTVAGLRADGIDFRGVLYGGLMVDDDGVPWILEYNVRFGDPETQPVLMRLLGDLGELLLAAASGRLGPGELRWDPRTAVCVILASAGYPGVARVGDPIRGLDAVPDGVVVFHAGTRREGQELVTAGGRVLGVTALGESFGEARELAYRGVQSIHFEGVQYRTDIGARSGAQER